MEPEDTPLFSTEQKEQLFPGFQRSESFMQEEPPFDYGTFYQNHPNKSIFEEFGFLTDRNNPSFEKFSQHCKSINGLQGFVTLGEKHKGQNMLDNASSEQINLPQFFGEPQDSPLQKHFASLRESFAGINSNLPGNFENFLYIEETNKHRFFQDIREGYFTMLKQCAKKKQPEAMLQQILEFWMRCFRDMLAAVDKCSPIYTLNLFKKEKDNRFIEVEEDLPPSNLYQDEQVTEKKKLWTHQQTARLEQLLENKVTLSSSVIQQLAVELNRSPVAVQSRLQKLQRGRRETSADYEHKLIHVLKDAGSKGYTKDVIAAKLKDSFKITEQTFKKTIYPILSSSRNVVKTKGVYSLKSTLEGCDNLNNFKNRVVACIQQLPNRRGDLKDIVHKYLERFARDQGINPEDSERLKTIEANINKTLHSYDIFDISKAKTVYRYIDRYDTESVFSSSDWSENQLRKA